MCLVCLMRKQTVISPGGAKHREWIEDESRKNSYRIPCTIKNINHCQYDKDNLVPSKYDNIGPGKLFHEAIILVMRYSGKRKPWLYLTFGEECFMRLYINFDLLIHPHGGLHQQFHDPEIHHLFLGNQVPQHNFHHESTVQTQETNVSNMEEILSVPINVK